MEFKYISEDIRNRIIEEAHAIHKNPELSHMEFMTTAKIIDILKEFDIEIPDSDVKNLTTIGEFCSYIEERLQS